MRVSLLGMPSCLLLALVLVDARLYAQTDRHPDKDKKLTFEQDIAPILNRHCSGCHGVEKREGGFDVRRRFSIVSGGDSGPAIVIGRPEKSLLVELLEDGAMPPEEKPRLNKQELTLLRDWIQHGAALAGKVELPLRPSADSGRFDVTEGRQHWAFQRVSKNDPPSIIDRTWPTTPVDTFVLAKLEERGWCPADDASRRVLIRRLYFDLTGLPPSPAAIRDFINDPSVDAYERIVDRLLASPQYGERWAQHWLDVVRFAETEGFEYDRHLPDAWRFRDYVINSLNSDKPFDQFALEQLAGDELTPANRDAQTAAIFHRLGAVRRNAGNPDIALSRNEVLTERTNIVGEAFLGLTIGCARCHNHKLEPISQRDYYRLQAYFAATAEDDIALASETQQKEWSKQSDKIKATLKELKAKAAKADAQEQTTLKKSIADLEYSLPKNLPTIPSIRNDFEKRTTIHILRRGIWEHKGAAVAPRPLSVLVSESMNELPAETETPRTQLARWLTHPDNPLTARVIVNRVWQHHFGVGLVETANDFGIHGAKPSHPQLLDWLARSLMENGWRLKPIHRLIVSSRTYRQASLSSQAREAASDDPNNRLLWRFSRRRLSAEEIRDQMLTVSGAINLQAAGPSIMVPVDAELVGLLYKPTQWRVHNDVAEHARRTIYLIAKRNLRLSFMKAFDAPALQTSCPERGHSTHAPQALELLNGAFANATADSFASRLQRECGDNSKAIVERGYWLALGRRPSETERRLSIEFVRDQPLREFALALINLNGFVYVR